MTESDPLSVRVRLLEARNHLQKAQESADRDDELVAAQIEAVVSDIETLQKMHESGPNRTESQWAKTD